MKSRSWIIVLVAVLVVLFWIVWPHQIQPVRVAEEKTDVPAAQKQTVANVPQSGPVVVAGAGSSRAQIDAQKLKQEPGALEKLVEARNRPIDFYGQTVDQDGNPLSGVQIKITVPYLTLDGRSIRVDRVSDSGGLFDVHDVTGDAVDIESMGKEGYTLEPCNRGLGPTGGAPGNPVVFKLWRNDIKEPLITGQKSFPIEPNGTPYVIDFGKGTIGESGSGDLSVWIKYDTHTIRGQLSDWLSEISVPSGGLLLESDLSSAMYVAPTNGYTNAFQYNQQIKGGQRGSTGDQRFYLMLKNGQEYGRITIGLFAPCKQTPGLIRIDYAINPTGSHILR